jgi:hypothetical protein
MPGFGPCPTKAPRLQEECDNFNHLKDLCIDQGCIWRGSSSHDRSKSRSLTALAVFIIIIVLIVIGVFVLRWLPARSLSTLTRESTTVCAAPKAAA